MSPEEQLILLCAGTAASREAQRARAQGLIAQVDWTALTERLRTRRLLHTLGPRLLELSDGDGGGSDDGDGGGRGEDVDRGECGGRQRFAAVLGDALSSGRRQGAFLQMIAARVMGELGDAEIASVPLKGPLLGEALYGDPGRRPSADVDLLVGAQQLHRAVDVVRALGYGPPTDAVDRRGLPLLHFALSHERGELPPIELHWRVHWYEERFAQERLLESVAVGDPGTGVASFEGFVALLLFYARDGFVDLRLATDIGAWWDAFGAHVRAGALADTVRAYPRLERALSAAVSVAQELVGLPREHPGLRATKLNRRGRVAARMANPNPRSSEAQIYADMGLVDGLLAPPRGMRAFVERQLLPPRAPGDGSRRAPSALWRALRVTGRYVLALAHASRAPSPARPG